MNKEPTQKTDYIYKGNIITLRLDTVLLPDNRTQKREIIEHAPAVAILPQKDASTVYLIKQFRKAIEQMMYEVPAGILEANETPLDGAKRELKEETGLSAKTWRYLGKFYPTPGFCDELIYLYHATDLSMGQQHLDQDEDIEPVQVTTDALETMIRSGDIVDGKTLLSYALFKSDLGQTQH